MAKIWKILFCIHIASPLKTTKFYDSEGDIDKRDKGQKNIHTDNHLRSSCSSNYS